MFKIGDRVRHKSIRPGIVGRVVAKHREVIHVLWPEKDGSRYGSRHHWSALERAI